MENTELLLLLIWLFIKKDLQDVQGVQEQLHCLLVLMPKLPLTKKELHLWIIAMIFISQIQVKN
jgi:hypothetical protein